MIAEAQDEVVRALADPGFYPHRPATVGHVQTHVSHVFLAGPYVYKLKKAVRFPFVDLTAAARRAELCREEVRLNRRLAAPVYLDVLPVTRAADGHLALGGPGTVVEHVVWMRRLPAASMLPARLAAGRVSPTVFDELAGRLVAFHAAAPAGAEVAAYASPERLGAQWDEELAALAPFVGTLLAAEDHAVLADFGASFVRRHETLLRARQQAGRIREGHGDLHAEHVCVLDAPVTDAEPPLAPGVYVFDCLEFSPALRSVDVASEVAFLAMDLECLGHPALAHRFVDAYATAAADPLLVQLVPFYACYRACIRGKVAGLASTAPEVTPDARAASAEYARRHFALATRYAWAAEGPAVIACCGLSGSGKSTLAAAVAAATGFTVLSSDVLRRAGGGTPTYTAAARDAVYERLAAATADRLAAGHGVVADATFMTRAHRERLAAVARAARRPLVFVQCHAGEAVVRERLGARAGTASVSDARWETYLAQRPHWEAFGAPEPHLSVDTTAGLAAARPAAFAALWRWRQGRPL